MMRHSFMAIAAAAAIAGALSAQLQIVTLGDNFDISDGETSQRRTPWPAYNSIDDEYMAVWMDSRNPANNDIFGQRIDADGTLIGVNFPVIEYEASQSDPAIAYNSVDNLYLVAWKTQHSGAFNHGYGRVLSADGGHFTNQFFISDAEAECSIAFNPDLPEYMYQARSPGVRGQRIFGDGTMHGSNLIVTNSGAPAPSGQVCYNPNAQEFMFTWRDQTDENLKGRRYSAMNGLDPNIITISELFPESGRAASVAFDPVNDQYFVVFGVFQAQDIYGQFVASDGSLIGDHIPIAINLPDRSDPFVARSPVENAYVVVWEQNTDIVAQLVLSDGTVSGDPVAIVTGTALGSPKLAANEAAPEFLVTWTDNRNMGQNIQEIFAQRIGLESGGGVTLSLQGACPGQVAATVTGATPNRQVVLAFASGPGSVQVPPGQPCSGTVTGLNQTARAVDRRRADGDGGAVFSGRAPSGACGGVLQAIDLESCGTSNVVVLR